MRFPELLRTTVILCGAAATLLAVVTVAGVDQNDRPWLMVFAGAWWLIAVLAGVIIGHRNTASHQIATLLASARTQTMLPEINPARVVLNRLWPIIVCTVGAGALAFAFPQISAIATGFAIIWALAWRRQSAAVSAIEERDGARFYVEHTSPLQPIKLVRTPGFRTSIGVEMRDIRGAADPPTTVAGRHA